MAVVHVTLVILALISFALAAVDVIAPRINLVALGLLLWLLSTLVVGG